MNDDLVAVFLYGLQQLAIDNTGLAPGNDIADLNAVAALCLCVKMATADADTPSRPRTVQIGSADRTTHHHMGVIPDDTITGEWLCARSELLQLQIPRP